MILVDHHCHLDFKDFAPELDGVVARAHAAGVGLLVSISTRIRAHATYQGLAERFPGVLISVGTHPHYAHEEVDIPVDEIVRLSQHPRCVAIGEAGLDYHYDKSPRADQRTGLLLHIEAARRTGLPLVIHSREADADMADILEAEMALGPFTFVLHCFTGSSELARRALALGGYISASGVITFKTSEALRNVFAEVPTDRILVETDAPYLAPPPHRGKRNEPAFVVATAQVLADVKRLPLAELARVTTDNFFRLYTKADRTCLQPPHGGAAR